MLRNQEILHMTLEMINDSEHQLFQKATFCWLWKAPPQGRTIHLIAADLPPPPKRIEAMFWRSANLGQW